MIPQQQYEVSAQDTAVALGSGDVDVLGTPRLIAWMEAATVTAAQPHLAPGQTSVGTAVRIRHRRSTSIGRIVTVRASLRDSPSSGQLSFTVEAEDTEGFRVADGEIDRAIVKRDGFGLGFE